MNVPARQFTGQLSILTPPAKNQRYLIGFDNNHRTVFRRMQDHTGNGRRLQRVGNQLFRTITPADQVTLSPVAILTVDSFGWRLSGPAQPWILHNSKKRKI